MMRWLSLVGVRPATNPVLTPALESLESLTDKNGLADGPASPFPDCVTKESLPESSALPATRSSPLVASPGPPASPPPRQTTTCCLLFYCYVPLPAISAQWISYFI